MFEHLKLKNIKVIKEASLLNLGKINVICGKNNSGKSTVLQGIDSEQRIVGKTFRETDSSSLLTKIPSIYFPLGGSTQRLAYLEELDDVTGVRNFVDKYFKTVKKTISKKAIWFEDEARVLSVNLIATSEKLFKKNIFEKVDAQVEHILKVELSRSDRVVFVPPIRSIDASGPFFQTETRLKSLDGQHLLSQLYWLKNQETHSERYKLYVRIKEAFQKVSSNHSFNITQGERDELDLRFAFLDSEEIKAVDCGLGLKDLLVIIYFALSLEYDVILLEEPENHTHPEMQRKLLRFLAEETDKQYFITTHSSIFLNRTYVDRVFFTEYKNGEIEVTDATSRATVLHNLGYSVTDNLVADLIILVEGSSDKNFIEEFLSKLKLDGKYNIKIWILGGSEMINQDLSVFKQDYEMMALIDKDTESEKQRVEFGRRCKTLDIYFQKLKRYSIESYFSVEALNEVFNKYRKNLPEIDGLSNDDLKKLIKDEPIWKKLSATDARQREIRGRIKSNVQEIAKIMNLREIEGTDLMSFFDKVQETLHQV